MPDTGPRDLTRPGLVCCDEAVAGIPVSVRDSTFVGRDAEVGQIRSMVAALAEGRGGVLLITGEAGIGKSALLAAGLAGAYELGCRCLWAAADELVARFPLRTLLDCLTAEEQAEITGPATASPTGFGMSADPVLAMVERQLAVVDRICARGPAVWVLDDLQWADEATLLAWNRLSRAVDQLPLLLIGSARPVPHRAEVAGLQRTLLGRGATVLPLHPLRPAEIDRLLDGLLTRSAGPALRRFAQRAGGNPLYLTELVDALVREDRLALLGHVAELSAPGAEPDLPSSLTAAIADRLEFLSDSTIQVLRLAAVLGTEFSVLELGTVSGKTATDLIGVIDEAVTASVLVGQGEHLVFRHPLLRQALYQSIPAGVRIALHHQAAHALADAHAPAERIAEQLTAAPEALNGWAFDWLAEHYPSLTRKSASTAAGLLEQAVTVVPADAPARDRLEAALAAVSFLMSHRDRAEESARRVLARTDRPELIGEMSWILAYALMRAKRQADALEAIASALAGPELRPLWRARLVAEQALMLLVCQRHDDARPVIAEALAAGERLGDPLTIGYALHTQSLMDMRDGDTWASVRTIRRALAAIGDDPETADLRQVLLANQMSFLGMLDAWDEVEACRHEAVALAEQASTARLCMVYVGAAEQLFSQGRWDDALAALESIADQLPDPAAWPEISASYAAIRALIAGHRDDRATLSDGVAEAQRAAETQTRHEIVFLALRAQAIEEERAGRPGRALAALRQCLDPDHSASRRSLRNQLLPPLTRLATELGEPQLAREAAEAAADDAVREPLPPKTAAADRCRGLAEHDAAAVLAAADYYRAHGRPLELAESLEDAAVVLAGDGELAAARRAFTEAAEVYLGLGAAWDLMRAESRMRPFGIRRGQRGPRRRPSNGWASLTPTELKVTRQVAAGKSNPDIATELFLSRRTVQTHVSHILAKLNAGSRIEIARIAARHLEPDRQARSIS